jgi:hypothetical protein
MGLRSVAFAFIAVLSLSSPSLAQKLDTPDKVVKKLYSFYGIGSATTATGLDEKKAAQVFDKTLLKLYQRAVRGDAIESDFFIQGQDWDIVKPIEITRTAIEGTTAKVSATVTQRVFDRDTRKDEFVFVVVRQGNGWLLDDAIFDGKSFTDALKAAIEEGEKPGQ